MELLGSKIETQEQNCNGMRNICNGEAIEVIVAPTNEGIVSLKANDWGSLFCPMAAGENWILSEFFKRKKYWHRDYITST